MERDWSWNKYRSEIVTQPKTNNLDYMIDPTLRNINRLFVLLWKMVTMVLEEFLQELHATSRDQVLQCVDSQ